MPPSSGSRQSQVNKKICRLLIQLQSAQNDKMIIFKHRELLVNKFIVI